MKIHLAVTVSIFLFLSVATQAQSTVANPILSIKGYPGAAPLLVVNGKTYIEVEALARLTQGTLSFRANRTTLELPAPDSQTLPSTPRAKAGFSHDFVQAGIEEMGLIREWRASIVNAVHNNSPVAEEWVKAQQRKSETNLALASAAASTDDDRSALPMIAAEYKNMARLSESYLAMRREHTAISPDSFDGTALEGQILTCARSFIDMIASQEFQDQPSCH